MKKNIQKELKIKGLKVVNYSGNYINDIKEDKVIDTKLILFKENKKFNIVLLEKKDDCNTLHRLDDNIDLNIIDEIFEEYNECYENEYLRLTNQYKGYFYTPWSNENINLKLEYNIVK